MLTQFHLLTTAELIHLADVSRNQLAVEISNRFERQLMLLNKELHKLKTEQEKLDKETLYLH